MFLKTFFACLTCQELPLQSTEVPIATVLEPNTYAKLASQLYKDSMIYLHQVTTDDGTALDSWTNIKRKYGLKGWTHNWHKTLQKQLCIADIPPPSDSDDINPSGDDSEANYHHDQLSGGSDYDGNIEEDEVRVGESINKKGKQKAAQQDSRDNTQEYTSMRST
jgi:hypothetical protein